MQGWSHVGTIRSSNVSFVLEWTIMTFETKKIQSRQWDLMEQETKSSWLIRHLLQKYCPDSVPLSMRDKTDGLVTGRIAGMTWIFYSGSVECAGKITGMTLICDLGSVECAAVLLPITEIPGSNIHDDKLSLTWVNTRSTGTCFAGLCWIWKLLHHSRSVEIIELQFQVIHSMTATWIRVSYPHLDSW
jgi:hypothetical protein